MNIICKICQKKFTSGQYKSGKFTNHLSKEHSISLEKYIIKTEYNNIEPKCVCGCGSIPEFHRGQFKKYTKFHNTFEWKEKEYIRKFGIPKCFNYTCNNNVKFYRGLPRKFCSIKCKPGSWNQEKIKNTVMKKYGVINVSQVPYIKQKIQKQLQKNMKIQTYIINLHMNINF